MITDLVGATHSLPVAVSARQRASDGLRRASTAGLPAVSPDAAFVLVSFEGPDEYSKAGGLGVRATGLSEALAELGFETHLFYVGDPDAPGTESRFEGRLQLHRWCQWLSGHHRAGVYDGEEAKREELCRSLPPFLLTDLVGPWARSGRQVVVLCEDWQTAGLACTMGEQIQAAGWGDRAAVWWNANNTYGFDGIDWPRLARTSLVLAVSRWMRHVLRAWGVDARVVPNGLPRRLVAPATRPTTRWSWRPEARRETYFKMARWSSEKGWPQALDAMAFMKERGRRPCMIARCGGPDRATGPIRSEVAARGLSFAEIDRAEQLLDLGTGCGIGSSADVIDLRFPVSETIASHLFVAADAVLANAVYEPFGLVGLEAMAAGGLVITSGTGEDYAVDRRNAVVLETLEPMEIVERTEALISDPDASRVMRTNAYQTARAYEWSRILRRDLMAPMIPDGGTRHFSKVWS